MHPKNNPETKTSMLPQHIVPTIHQRCMVPGSLPITLNRCSECLGPHPRHYSHSYVLLLYGYPSICHINDKLVCGSFEQRSYNISDKQVHTSLKDNVRIFLCLFEARITDLGWRRQGHILLIKPRGKRRNFYEVRDLTIICHQFYVPLKQIVLTGLFRVKRNISAAPVFIALNSTIMCFVLILLTSVGTHHSQKLECSVGRYFTIIKYLLVARPDIVRYKNRYSLQTL